MRDVSSGGPVAEAWRSHRPYLVNLAYQMLGDVGEAEDAVQEAFLRLARTGHDEIEDIRGWLTVVVGRLCLDTARSARAKREYPGDEAALAAGPPVHASGYPDPADRVTLDDEVRAALMEVLRRLSPAERVAFVLHDVFQIPFDTIAQTVGRPVGTCRQLARRGREKIHSGQPRLTEVPDLEHQVVTEKFITACANGDIDALTAVLDPSVWGVGTVIAEPPIRPQINYGPSDVATQLLRYLGPGSTLVSGPVGQHVLLGFLNRRLFAVIVLTVRDNLVVKIEATADASARLGAAGPSIG